MITFLLICILIAQLVIIGVQIWIVHLLDPKMDFSQEDWEVKRSTRKVKDAQDQIPK